MLLYVLQRILLITVPLGLGLIAAEYYASTTKAGNAAIFVEDPDLYVVREPGIDGFTYGNARWIPVHINREGMRGDELPKTRNPEESWILCIGDSFTFGGGVETAEAWPQQLQTILGPPEASKIRVLNGGANGWDTPWQRLYLERRGLPQVKPKVVVLGFNWNDLEITADAPQQAIAHFIRCERVPTLRFFARYSFLRSTHLYRLYYCKMMGTEHVPTDEVLAQWYIEYRAKRERQVIQPERALDQVKKTRRENGTLDQQFWLATDTPDWKVVRAELTRMRDLCNEAGVRFLVVQMPEPTWDGPGRFPGAERLDTLLASIDVPTIDLQPPFLHFDEAKKQVVKRPELWLRYDPFHPTAAGQRLFAEGVAAKLKELGWIP